MKKSVLIHIIFLLVDISILILVILISSFNEETNNLPPYVLPDDAIQEFDLNGYKEFSIINRQMFEYDEYNGTLSFFPDDQTYSTYTVDLLSCEQWDTLAEDAQIGSYQGNEVLANKACRVISIETNGELFDVKVLNTKSFQISIQVPQAKFNNFNMTSRCTAIIPTGDEIILSIKQSAYSVVNGNVQVILLATEENFNVIPGMTGIKVRINQTLFTDTNYFLSYDAFYYNNRNNYINNQYFTFIKKQFNPSTETFSYSSINIKAGIRIGDLVAVLNPEPGEYTILVKVA
jgi:hypothetical protein